MTSSDRAWFDRWEAISAPWWVYVKPGRGVPHRPLALHAWSLALTAHRTLWQLGIKL